MDKIDENSEQLLEDARRDAETFGVPVETHTVLSHESFEEIFDVARNHKADLVVMGWGADSHGAPGRVEGRFDELTGDLPCDFLVLKDRGFDPERILVPTAGGPDSDLGVSVAKDLRAEYGSKVTLLHVADEGEAESAREFIAEWAENHGLDDPNLLVETGDVEAAIEHAAADCSLVILGATERGMLSRLVRGSLALDVVDDLDCSVLLAEKSGSRSLRERLFGR